MLTSVYSHVFLAAAGFNTDNLPPIDDSIPEKPKKRRFSFEIWRKVTPAPRETREQYEAPASTSCQ